MGRDSTGPCSPSWPWPSAVLRLQDVWALVAALAHRWRMNWLTKTHETTKTGRVERINSWFEWIYDIYIYIDLYILYMYIYNIYIYNTYMYIYI